MLLTEIHWLLANLEIISIIAHMVERRLKNELKECLRNYPAVVLLGPRQAGKTTLARVVANEIPSLYLDLESEIDRRKLANPETYLRTHADKLIILDEVHRTPEIFRVLRGLIDADLPRERRNSRFLLLGSASLDLLRQTDESLAGRVAHLELTPFDALEVQAEPLDKLWIRGGFPMSFLAESGAMSMRRRRDFIRSYLERDIPQFGIRVPAATLERFLIMLAHRNGGLHNASSLARNLAVDGKTIAHYVDLLVDLLLVRRLRPWFGNVGKRLVKSPKLYIRDTGILHALLDIPDRDVLLSHPVFGASWESFAIEQLCAALPYGRVAHFYRTAAGNEIDLMLDMPAGERWAIEVKASEAPSESSGFLRACETVRAHRRFVVYAGDERFPVGERTEAIGLRAMMREILASASNN